MTAVPLLPLNDTQLSACTQLNHLDVLKILIMPNPDGLTRGAGSLFGKTKDKEAD